MARRTIDPAVKTAILAAALAEGAKLAAIAKQYGVSLPSVYNWRNAARAAEKAAEVVASAGTPLV
jgi:transposase-like protein